MRARFISEYALPEYDALVLTASKAMATYFVAVVEAPARKTPRPPPTG
jgi:aspartyl-tRNA(Asn)/glutamyl-tRNA(Gln) amidotransferase subunit B